MHFFKKLFFISLFVIFLCFINIIKADVGVGIHWNTEELSLKEYEERCIEYIIYNPFNKDVSVNVEVQQGLEKIVTKIEPASFSILGYKGAPNDNEAKFANSQKVKICFKANPLRWPPFYPLKIKGVIIAAASPGTFTGMGSTTASAVQAPLTLYVGSMGNFYKFIVVLIIVIVIIIIALLKLLKKLPKRKKKFCKKCNKWFSARFRFCPNCSGELE
jgi:hypothetical protein